MTGELNLHLGKIETSADDSKSTLSKVGDSRQAVDRQHGNRLNQTNGGIGTDQIGRGRNHTRRNGEDIDTGVTSTLNKMTENAGDIVRRSGRAAEGL